MNPDLFGSLVWQWDTSQVITNKNKRNRIWKTGEVLINPVRGREKDLTGKAKPNKW